LKNCSSNNDKGLRRRCELLVSFSSLFHTLLITMLYRLCQGPMEWEPRQHVRQMATTTIAPQHNDDSLIQ
jgi:hypothetical protein